MGQLCDFCSEQRSMVYCRSDAAFLCLSCDRNVHSANALSRRHSRTLVCERCSSQPAEARCMPENISLCQNCDWNAHGDPTSDIGHKRQTVNCYTGCPSAGELSRIWSFISMGNSSSKDEIGSMSLEKENQSLSHCQPMPIENRRSDDAKNSMSSDDKICENRSLNHLNEKACSSSTTFLKQFDDDYDLYKDFDISDIDLSLDNVLDLFGDSLDTPQQFTESDGLDSLFETPTFSGGEINKDSSMQAASSNTIFGDSVTSCITDPNIGFPRQEQSNQSFSFSGQTGDCSIRDYQESGMSSMFMYGEPQCLISSPEIQLPSATRDSAVSRYREKKKLREFGKKIRYAKRKATADVRRRVKGRFVKAGDPYDYDPSCHTNNQ